MTVTRSYGSLLIDLSKFVPDGVVVFFPSYMYSFFHSDHEILCIMIPSYIHLLFHSIIRFYDLTFIYYFILIIRFYIL